jgi:mRNA-binding protein PUF3
VKELEKNVILCVKDQNGNHVIQKAIERVPSEYIQFIIEAFKGKVKDLSLHQYGCRVIQRLLEHGEEPTKRFILQELYDLGPGLLELIDHQYGNYVIQHILLYGTPEDRAHVIAMVRDHLFDLSSHKFSSNVVEHCLINANDAQRRDIMLKTFEKSPQGENGLLTLVKDQFGNYVIRTSHSSSLALQKFADFATEKIMDTISSDDHATFLTALRPALEEAKPDISGKQYIAVRDAKLNTLAQTDNPSGRKEDASFRLRQQCNLSTTHDTRQLHQLD